MVNKVVKVQQKIFHPVRKSYLPAPPTELKTIHFDKRVNWLTKGTGKPKKYLDLGDIQPLDEAAYRTLLGG